MSLVAGYGRRAALALVAASAAGALLVAASPARAETFASTVDIVGSGYDLDVVQMNGSVETAKRACRRNREVEMSVTNDLGEKKFSTDHTSDNGFWGGRGHADGGDFTFKARMKPKRIGTSGDRCAGDTDTVTPHRPNPRRATPYPTTVGIFSSATSKSLVQLWGQVFARKKCRKDRTIKIQANFSSGRETVDVDHASDNGFWGGEGVPSEAPVSARAFAPKKKLDAKHSCAAGSDDTNF